MHRAVTDSGRGPARGLCASHASFLPLPRDPLHFLMPLRRGHWPASQTMGRVMPVGCKWGSMLSTSYASKGAVRLPGRSISPTICELCRHFKCSSPIRAFREASDFATLYRVYGRSTPKRLRGPENPPNWRRPSGQQGRMMASEQRLCRPVPDDSAHSPEKVRGSDSRNSHKNTA